ncbi:MAG: hypothetical protein KGM49_13450, partial [Sphingomonadales bacterium]|nr:hypothetical protein [Sphingomonadales bacterium]
MILVAVARLWRQRTHGFSDQQEDGPVAKRLCCQWQKVQPGGNVPLARQAGALDDGNRGMGRQSSLAQHPRDFFRRCLAHI